jgi:hypothetical protein
MTKKIILHNQKSNHRPGTVKIKARCQVGPASLDVSFRLDVKWAHGLRGSKPIT